MFFYVIGFAVALTALVVAEHYLEHAARRYV